MFHLPTSVREAAESLNHVLLELIEDLDDRPTPASGTPSRENPGEGNGDNQVNRDTGKEEVTSKSQTNIDLALDK